MVSAREQKKPCRTRDRIHLEWSDATAMYTRLLASLTEKTGTLPRDEYAKRRDMVETIRMLSESLRRDKSMRLETGERILEDLDG